MSKAPVRTALGERNLLFRATDLARGDFSLELRPSDADWIYSGLRIARLAPGQSVRVPTDDVETGVLSISGSAEVVVDGQHIELQGRASPFSGPSDFVYVPVGAKAHVRSDDGAELALMNALADRRLPVAYIAAEHVMVTSRGAGNCARLVRSFCVPELLDAQRLLAVEIVTPGGNWSSYPPHKHDEESAHEVPLEEIYYFRTAGPPAFALHTVYRRHPAGALDASVSMVEDGDLVVVPDSYHGPTVAGPGYDLYYLNVLAGPSRRALAVCDDPSHAWIRDRWSGEAAVQEPAAEGGTS